MKLDMFLNVIKSKLKLSTYNNYTNLKRSKHFFSEFISKIKKVLNRNTESYCFTFF